MQYHLHTQLSEVCAYARSRGVVLKGDLPIGVSRTSADAWIHPRLFHMDSQAGAPPDAFSASGQNWGFPTYDWEHMAQDGYAWWQARMAKMAEYFDAFRIDHILGFFRIWEIPVHAVHGLLGYFNPALPYSADELRGMGFDTAGGRFTVPAPDDRMLGELFGELADEVRTTCMKEGRLLPAYATQRKVAEHFPGRRSAPKPSARRADGAARRRTVHRGPGAAKVFSTPASRPNRPICTAPSTRSGATLSTGFTTTSFTAATTVLAGVGPAQTPRAPLGDADAGLRRGPRHDSRQRSRNHARTANPFARNPADAQIAGRGVRRPGALPLFLGLHHLDPRHESPAGMVGGEP